MTKKSAQEKLLSIYEGARKFGERRRMDKQTAQDFAAFVAQKILSGRNATIKHLRHDFLRLIYGNVIRSAPDLLPRFCRGMIDRLVSQQDEGVIEFTYMLEGLDQQARSVVVMRFLWGMTLVEIAYVLGVQESRISQILAEALVKIKEVSCG